MVKLLYHLEWGLWKGNGFSNLVNECTSGVPEESGALVKVNDSFRMKSHQPGAGRIGSHRIVCKHNLPQRPRLLYWLDLGNNASSGQFILGQPKNRVNQKKKHRLPTVTELFPEIALPSAKDDDQPSCSAAEALTRQEPFINQNLAYQALGMLTQLLRHGALSYQGGFCNLATGQLVPLPIRHKENRSGPTRNRTTRKNGKLILRSIKEYDQPSSCTA